MRIVEFLGIRIKMLRLMISKIKIQFDKIILKVKSAAVKVRMKIVIFSKKSKRSPKSLKILIILFFKINKMLFSLNSIFQRVKMNLLV
jgi:hypothetical protein